MQFCKRSKTTASPRRDRRFRPWRNILFGAVLVLDVASDIGARAEEAGRQWSFDIAPESLAKALIAYSNTTGIEVAIDSRDVRDRQSVGVRGTMDAGQALDVLLLGNQLSIHRLGATVILSPIDASDQNDPASLREQSYYAKAQFAILRQLCQLNTTMPGAFRVAVKLWIDHTGKVMLAKRLVDTGDPERNAALDRAFEQLDVGAPPRELRQPIAVLISPNGSPRAACQSARTEADRESK